MAQPTMFKFTLRNLLRIVMVPVLLAQATLAMAVEPPVNLRAIINSPTDVRWEWDWATDAQQYEVTIDGLVLVLTPNTWYTSTGLWPGEHSMSLKTVDIADQYSLPSVEIIINTTVANNTAVNAGNSTDTSADINTDGTSTDTNTDTSTDTSADINTDGTSTDTSADINTDTGSATNIASDTNVGPSISNDAFNRKLRSLLSNINSASINLSASSIDPETHNYAEAFGKTGYELTFSDEFNGLRLNTAKWNTQLRWDGEYNGERYEYRVINGESQFYVNIYSEDQQHLNNLVPRYNPFEFDGSRLAIRAQPNPLKSNDGVADHGSLLTVLTQQDFLSGAISTYDKFVQKYGYFEARIKIPSQTGAFPAFWLHHQRTVSENTRKSEIDIMENLGHAPWFIYNTFHYFENVSESNTGDGTPLKPNPTGQIYNGTDFSLDYHTYAVAWDPGYVAWYLDGEKVSELFNNNVNFEELYLILNLAIGGNWTNYPADIGGLGRSTNDFFPNWDDLNTFSNPALEIDYVRVYRRK